MMLQNIFGRRTKSGCADKIGSHLLKHIRQSRLIRCPLLLVSQISRSGGTWLSQLLDHHPQTWAHPSELRFGYSRQRWEWPDLSAVNNSEEAWQRLLYAKVEERFGAGTYNKGNDETHPMLFSAEIQRGLFFQLAEDWKPAADRDWLNIYFTSFFSAWLDHQRRYGPKRYVTAFASMLALTPSNMARFRQAYPDGWLISLVREPLGWYASVKRRSSGRNEKKSIVKPHYYGPEAAQAAYLDNLRAIEDNRSLFGNHFILVDYQDLLSDTEGTMRSLATRIGLDWDPSLTRQTFNGMLIEPNTAFRGVATEDRPSVLTQEDVARITEGPMMAAYRASPPAT
jgi:Sulfotransferase family